MSSPPTDPWPLTPDPSVSWLDIERLLEAVRSLASEDLSPEDFYARTVEALVSELAAAGGVAWQRLDTGKARAVSQLRPERIGLVDDPNSQRFHLQTVEQSLATGRSVAIPPRSSASGAVNPTGLWLVFAPVADSGYLLELFLDGDRDAESAQGIRLVLDAAASMSAEFHRRQLSRQLSARLAAADAIDQFAARVYSRLDLDATALAIVNESARLFSADRVSLALLAGKNGRTLAVSGVESFDRRAAVIRALETLAATVAAAGELAYPSVDELAPQATAAITGYIDAAHSSRMLAIPLFTSDRPFAVLVIEYFEPSGPPLDRGLLSAVARHSAAALDNALLCRRSLWLRLSSRWFGEESLRRRQSGRWRWVLAAAAIAAAVVGLWPVDFYIPADGTLQPARQRDVFAPMDGIVTVLAVAERTAVQAGEELAAMHSPDLELSISEVLGKRQATEAAIAAARALRLTNPDARGTSEPGRYAAQEEELAATLAGLEKQYEILQQQQRELTIKSPLAGEVVTRDLDQRLAGRPVRGGELLMRVADVTGPWKLDLELPEHRLEHVRTALTSGQSALGVRFLIGASPSQAHSAELESIAGSSQIDDSGRTYVPLRAAVEDAGGFSARPGATVQAKIHCGRRSLAYVWLHDAWEAVLSRWWH